MFFVIQVREGGSHMVPCSARLRLLLGMAILQPHLVSVNGTSSSPKRYVGHDTQIQNLQYRSHVR